MNRTEQPGQGELCPRLDLGRPATPFLPFSPPGPSSSARCLLTRSSLDSGFVDPN